MSARKDDFSLIKHGGDIRAAFRKGKKVITLDDREFNIRKVERVVKFDRDGETVKQKQQWLVVSPVKGSFPVGNLAYPNAGSNSKVSMR